MEAYAAIVFAPLTVSVPGTFAVGMLPLHAMVASASVALPAPSVSKRRTSLDTAARIAPARSSSRRTTDTPSKMLARSVFTNGSRKRNVYVPLGRRISFENDCAAVEVVLTLPTLNTIPSPSINSM